MGNFFCCYKKSKKNKESDLNIQLDKEKKLNIQFNDDDNYFIIYENYIGK